MKKLITILILVNAFYIALGQESADSINWKKGGDYSFNFSQVSFSNWAGGGLNAVSGVTQLNIFTNCKKDRLSWDNMLQMGFGLTSQEGLPTQKSEDVIDFKSKFGLKSESDWFYSALFGFKSQFADGFSDPEHEVKISSLFAPAYITLSVGMDYKPSESFAVLLSPLAGKMTIVADKSLTSRYGVEDGNYIRMEMGAQITSFVKKEVLKNVNLSSEMSLFSNYLDKPQNIDVDWQLAINMKVNEYLSAKINTRLIYDDDIKTANADTGHLAPQLQFKELFGIGLSLKF